uniref:Uncharacterized protein n=1 Tax=Attheya septentrionalis TaxID=420275 RepID=A0A7S2U7D3_9STRA|mmetsp:Transcript_13649/g.24712  ORF Transcript_13649/g.24712 Transcript_13649/m.24712 type:complete len:113 (+) Transcript_13649:55-393(+)
MSKGIDYSKWDHLDYGSSSDEDDNDEAPSGQQPRVTRLDTPSRVTRSPTGAVSISASSNDPPLDRMPNHSNSDKSLGVMSLSTNKKTPLLTSNTMVPPTTEPTTVSSSVTTP